MRRLAPLLAAALLALLPACAPRLEPLTPESIAAGQAVATQMAARRAAHGAAAALVQAELESTGRIKVWPSFTAALRYGAPDWVVLNGYSDIGLPLFTYEAEGGRYTVTRPDGASDGGDTAHGDPAADVLNDLTHLLDGSLGVDLAGAKPRRARDGRWFANLAGTAAWFSVDGDQVTDLWLKRSRRKPTVIHFDDFRDVPGGPLPYRMDVDLAEYGVRAVVSVMEWSMGPPLPPREAANGP